MPQLRLPTARLYGKDCGGERRELDITAEVSLEIEADGKAVTAPMFVQPDSEQPCLLGIFDTTLTPPERKGRFLEAKVDPTIEPGTEIL
jgi:hypothetical protein